MLSAALIVRDEEHHLGACLASLAGVCDEIVVVDTGSIDGTVAIAIAHGARVLERPWDGDFAGARNHGLDHLTGDWVLQVDADERLEPVARAELMRLLDDDGHVAYRVGLRPAPGTTPYRELRLWRSRPDIRFRGVIHEKIHPAIDVAARADGLRVGEAPVALAHVGYEGDQTHKHRRNLPLLEAQLAVDPDDHFNWRHLGEVRLGLGDEAGALDALQRAVALDRPAAGRPTDPRAAIAYGDLLQLLRTRGEDTAALMAEARARHPGDWMLVWLEARFLLDDGRPGPALERLDRLLAAPIGGLPGAISYDVRIFGALAHEARGLALFRLGRFAEAAAAYRAAETGGASPELAAKRALAEARATAEP